MATAHGVFYPPSEICTEHDGRLIDMYCSSHDAVCCSVCVSENHRACPDISNISEVASGISTSKELQNAQTSTKTLKTRLDTDTNYLDAHLLDGNIMAVHLSDANIKSSTDMKPCRITGICSLEAGGLIIADFENSCLKTLDMSFKMESRWYFSGGPWDVCQTGSTEEVAVTMLKDKIIQFVSVGQTLSLTRSFTLSGDDECSGISYFHGKLYVSRPNGSVHSVQIYDMSGALLQTIQKDKTGAAIFDIPLHIAVSSRTSNIYVTDYSKGLIIMDKSGQFVTTISNPDLEKTYGVCVLPRDQLLVCGRGSDNIIHFDAQGQNIRTLLTAADGLKHPETLHVDPDRSLLIVGLLYSDTIKVYSLVKR